MTEFWNKMAIERASVIVPRGRFQVRNLGGDPFLGKIAERDPLDWPVLAGINVVESLAQVGSRLESLVSPHTMRDSRPNTPTGAVRSEERRVGKECFVPCTSRW